jgi:hypothetical protein
VAGKVIIIGITTAVFGSRIEEVQDGLTVVTEIEGRGRSLRWFGFEAESGLGEESVDQPGPVLDPLEPVLDLAARIADAIIYPRTPSLSNCSNRTCILPLPRPDSPSRKQLPLTAHNLGTVRIPWPFVPSPQLDL